MLNVAIIGFGYAGKRFYNVLKARQQIKKDVDVIGICDTNPEVFNLFDEVKTYTKLEELFRISNNIDMVVVAVNEKYRFDVFERLLNFKNNFKIIISEKLLTEHVFQAEKLLDMYNQTDIFVHFVERFSPVVTTFYDWMNQNKLVVKRANFFWGKNRLYDKRPTIGVISEISHPLDLILYLGKVNYDENIDIISGNFVFSDYSSFNIDLLETINVSIKVKNNLFIYGNSSFLWNARDRRITLFLANNGDNNIKYIANLFFDNPSWDNDRCEIYEIDSVNKNIKEIKTFYSTATNDNLKGLNKIYIFLDEVIKQIEYKKNMDKLPNLKSSVCIQKIVNNILDKANKSAYHFNINDDISKIKGGSI